MTNLAGYTENDGYLQFPVTVDPDALTQNALAAIATALPGWVPVDGNIEVILLQQFAAMVAETAQVAAQVPLGIFAYLGSLVGIQPNNGSYATAPTTWTVSTSLGYTIPAGTVVAYATSGNTQVLFETVANTVIPPGSTTATNVQIQAQVLGAASNGLGVQTLTIVQPALAAVSSVVSSATSSGGADAEGIYTYLNRLSNELQLLTPRPILPADFAAIVTSAVDSSGNSLGVYRAVAINGLNPGRTITGTITLASSTALVDTAGSFTVNDVGKSVTGTDIPTSTTISAYVSATQVTMNNAATASITGSSVVLGDLTNQERCVAVCPIDVNGNGFDATVSAEIEAFLNAKREINFIVGTLQPTVTEIDVNWSGVAGPGASVTAVEAAANGALAAFLAQANWGADVAQFNGTLAVDSPTIESVVPLLTTLATGQPISGYGIPADTTVLSVNDDGSVTMSQNATATGVAILTVTLTGTWSTTANVVRYLQIVSVLAATPGLAYVSSVTLGEHGGSLSAADYTLAGDAPLAAVGTITGSVSSA